MWIASRHFRGLIIVGKDLLELLTPPRRSDYR